MGVLKFFRYISIKYNDCLIPLQGSYLKCESANSKGVQIDWLELDLNSIFHPVAQEYLSLVFYLYYMYPLFYQ